MQEPPRRGTVRNYSLITTIGGVRHNQITRGRVETIKGHQLIVRREGHVAVNSVGKLAWLATQN